MIVSASDCNDLFNMRKLEEGTIPGELRESDAVGCRRGGYHAP